MSIEEYLNQIKQMIDDLKAMSANLGLANTGDEYKIISELFTYKFLNDKLLYGFDKREDKEETFEDFVDFAPINMAKMHKEHLVDHLYQQQGKDNFNQILDQAFIEVNELNKDIYTVETVSGQKKNLFEPLSTYIRDSNKELELARRAINIMAEHKFTDIYEDGFDYFSSVFEYLIKDYNKDSGKYAEYFTPVSVADIISAILYNDQAVRNVSVYDPASGSGTLLLSMANKIGTDNCTIYSQDISQKSTQFLRINLILNKLVHSLHNVVEGDTLLKPDHLDPKNPDQLMKFDFIVSNPPFKTDFSNSIEALKADKYDRFFAGLPNIPKKKKESMAIYETFFQHILSSLNGGGKAAIVVPTGFVSASTGIPQKIKQKLINNNWLMGVIHMPSNIFANTGTSVSIILIDKSKADEKVMLVDGSHFGKKVKLDEGQRTLLNEEEHQKLIDTFKERREEPEFSVLVSNDDIKEKSYTLSAGQYVEMKEEKLDFDIDERLTELKNDILTKFKVSNDLEKQIKFVFGVGKNDL
ncbi:type I restriction-modification system subunit M [Domibacillus sp. A3M-37]|uniref:HsdM family class I SAM-dependent methyltransferase n=1 Tax=Domibacillus sp. A3M-37 TaxID=2962037 RepID=UPI0020B7FB41|nr:class I SAM-dependent DNA methyltransferase [Domibacillus sp. A3M-37]MCP3763747.1 type I restriction-modification system subunit M [Domibacillus sp. A3M-37]